MKNTILALGVLGLICGGFSNEAEAQAVVVDNNSPGFTASSNWSTASGATQYGNSFRFRMTAAVSDPATWSAAISTPGTYRVYAWWVSGANRTASAPYIISHAGGSTTVNVNQQVNGGMWNHLGNFNFNTGITQVKLSPWTTTGYVIVADAIRWQ